MPVSSRTPSHSICSIDISLLAVLLSHCFFDWSRGSWFEACYTRYFKQPWQVALAALLQSANLIFTQLWSSESANTSTAQLQINETKEMALGVLRLGLGISLMWVFTGFVLCLRIDEIVQSNRSLVHCCVYSDMDIVDNHHVRFTWSRGLVFAFLLHWIGACSGFFMLDWCCSCINSRLHGSIWVPTDVFVLSILVRHWQNEYSRHLLREPYPRDWDSRRDRTVAL